MKVFLATTLCDGKLYGDCAQSIIGNIVELIKAGHTAIHYPSKELYIDHSRNTCVKTFLETDADVLVFIDADLKFDNNAILKLINHDKDIVCGAYRYKKDDVDYPVVIDWSRNNNCKDKETGLVYVKSAPTGLMKIKRNVFSEIEKHYNLSPDTNGIIDFFDTGKRFNNNEWWGEDTLFCKRWTDMGNDIFVEPDINFIHIGLKEYSGNFKDYLLSRRVDKLDYVEEGIPGWLTKNEISILKYLAYQSDDVVEIGCWKGRSTKELLESCKGNVFAVDHWNGTDTDFSSLASFGLDVFSEFKKNVGHYKNLQIVRGDSLSVVKNFVGKADMIFIDAGHSYEEIKADLEAWIPHTRKIISGHDYCDNYMGVKKAVDEKFKNVYVVDSLWWVNIGE